MSVPCKKNDSSGYVFYISLISQDNTKIFQVNPTLHADDFNIAVDDNAPGAMDTTPVIDGDFTRRVKVVLSQAETNGDNLTFIASDAVGDEWCDLTVNIQTSAQTLDEIGTNLDLVKVTTDSLTDLGTLVDAVWDEALTGADHNDATSAGRRLRTAGQDVAIQREDTCQAGEDASHVKLDLGADGNDNHYDNMTIYLTSGTGSGQVRFLDAYNGTTFVAEVHPDWTQNPDGATEYTIIAHGEVFTHEMGPEGLAQINAEMVDVLKTDTLAELPVGIPPANPTFEECGMLPYMAIRNQLKATASELSIYNDAGTKIAKKALSDDGTIYTEDKMESGA